MTKSELKPGYVVRYRCGDLRMVMQLDGYDKYVLIEMESKCPCFGNLQNFNADLTSKYGNGNDNVDIVEVYGFSKSKNSAFKFDEHDRELLWKRKEKKQYTYAQLREILGEEFEVVG